MLGRVPADVLYCIVQWLLCWRDLRALRCVNRHTHRTLRNTEHCVPRRLAAAQLDAQLQERASISREAAFLLSMRRPGEPCEHVADTNAARIALVTDWHACYEMDHPCDVQVTRDGQFTLTVPYLADTVVALACADTTLESLSITIGANKPVCVYLRADATGTRGAFVSVLGWPERTRYYNELPLVALPYTKVTLHGQVAPLPLRGVLHVLLRMRFYGAERRRLLKRQCQFVLLQSATDAQTFMYNMRSGCLTPVRDAPHYLPRCPRPCKPGTAPTCGTATADTVLYAA